MPKFSSKEVLIFGTSALFISFVLIWYLPNVLIEKFPKYITHTKEGMSYGTVGDTLGGTMGPAIAFIGVVVTFFAFWIQYQANELQKDSLKEQIKQNEVNKLENTFYELLKLHRDNVNEIKYEKFRHTLGATNGKHSFRQLYYEFTLIYDELSPIFQNANEDDIYIKKYSEIVETYANTDGRSINLKTYAQIDICYIFLFFGVGTNGSKIIQHILSDKYNDKFVKLAIDYLSLKPFRKTLEYRNWKKFLRLPYNDRIALIEFANANKEKKESLRNNSTIMNNAQLVAHFRKKNTLHNGNQTILGNYYRHLFQTVSTINNKKLLDYDSKYDLIKTLRAQLSTYEQFLFALNSLSQLGRVWELELRDNHNTLGIQANNQPNMQLITKYNFIKNIPINVIHNDIDLLNYYPNVEYETFNNLNTKVVRQELLKAYT